MQVKRQINKAVRTQKFCAQIVKGVKGSEPIKKHDAEDGIWPVRPLFGLFFELLR